MDEGTKTNEKSRLQRQITRFFHARSEWSHKILNVFEKKNWEAVLFGGVPRGVHKSPAYSPRDLDIVVADQHFGAFSDFFAPYIVRETRFGGIHLEWNEIEIDAWPLESTWAFRKKLIPEAGFESLVKTTFFNADALAVDLVSRKNKGRKIYECGFFDAWHERVLEINLEENPFPELCVVRGLQLADHYHFRFSPRVTRFVCRCFDTMRLEDFERMQLSHYSRCIYSRNHLSLLSSHMHRHLDTEPLLPFTPFDLSLDDYSQRRLATRKQLRFHPF